jgi:hypothetical protein
MGGTRGKSAYSGFGDLHILAVPDSLNSGVLGGRLLTENGRARKDAKFRGAVSRYFPLCRKPAKLNANNPA